jgi:hypothetical protein
MGRTRVPTDPGPYVYLDGIVLKRSWAGDALAPVAISAAANRASKKHAGRGQNWGHASLMRPAGARAR